MEGETKITTVEKVKNPKRVEQGKRLAAISREAKARKAQLKQQEQESSSSCLPYASAIVIGVVAFGGYYYWSTSKKEETESVKEVNNNRLERL